jgi:hypothetical protein
MISEYEAAKLRRDMEKELHEPSTTLVRCAIGLLVVVLLAAVSPSLGTEEGANGAAGTTASAAAADL